MSNDFRFTLSLDRLDGLVAEFGAPLDPSDVIVAGGGAVRYVMGRPEWMGVGRPNEIEVTVHLPERPVLGIWTEDDDGGAG